MEREAKIHLIISYLDGTLEQEQQAVLEKLLADDTECSELFYKLSLQHMLLHKIGKEAHASLPASPFRRVLKYAVWAAAAIVLTAGLIPFFRPDQYPSVRITGDYAVSENEKGSSVSAGRGKAECILGGYCTVTMEPGAVLQLQGEKGREAVFLEKGMVICEVEPDRGSFEVRTQCGTVRVKGTVFSVRILPEDRIRDIHAEVEVEEGEVEVLSGEEKYVLAAGDRLTFPSGPEPAPAVAEGGPMLRQGNRLYVASGSVLCVIDCVSGDVLLRTDLSGLDNNIDHVSAFQGSAMLLARGERLLWVQNGRIFVFDRKSLTYISTIRIAHGKEQKLQHSSGSGETDDVF